MLGRAEHQAVPQRLSGAGTRASAVTPPGRCLRASDFVRALPDSGAAGEYAVSVVHGFGILCDRRDSLPAPRQWSGASCGRDLPKSMAPAALSAV